MNNTSQKLKFVARLLSLIIGVSFATSLSVNGQCTTVPNAISGKIFLDFNNDGSLDVSDDPIGGILVTAYNAVGMIAGVATTMNDGTYLINGVSDGSDYKVVFEYPNTYRPSYAGTSNYTTVQFVTAPTCSTNLGLIGINNQCGTNPEIITTCFVQGKANSSEKTIIGFEYGFNPSSTVKAYATHAETGSVWGIAWKSGANEIYSSAFYKQYAGLKDDKLGGIYKTEVNGATSTTSLYVDLATKANLGTMPYTDAHIDSCYYGDQVGRIGLGGMVISPDERYLYVVNIYGKSIIKLSTTNPNDVIEYPIQDPGCGIGNTYMPFALHFNGDILYIGGTCVVGAANAVSQSKAIVYEWDPETPGLFTEVFSTNYISSKWYDSPTNGVTKMQFLSDIDFTDEGNMVLGYSDRVGHRYCHNQFRRLNSQNPDILLVYKDAQGQWTLESNGSAGALTGSGVSNGEGPGGGEFFGKDNWPRDPTYHNETALGSFFVYPGSGSIVAAVYDPNINAYSGGFHRYSTFDGSLINYRELYTTNTSVQFGKATGFGEVVSKCSASSIQIGNFVWHDVNKNGVQDAGEDPVVGLPIRLLDEDCNVIQSTSTSNTGNYYFSNIEGGKNYYIAFDAVNYDAQYGLVNVNGTNYVLASADNGGDLIDSDAVVLSVDCGEALILVNTGFTDHTFDIGLIPAGGFDLALKKDLVKNDLVRLGDTIDFAISIYNQGGIPAKDIEIIDYIPSGYEFLVSENPDWDYDGQNAISVIEDVLLPGQVRVVFIRLKLISTDLNKIVNIAEITGATDHNGNPVLDIDSTPDDDEDNDNGGQVGSDNDGNITDDGTQDEDDSDPALPRIFDLALKQYYNASCLTGGDEITVKVCVFNQGNVDASSFKVINYGSPYFEFDQAKNPDWIKNGTSYEYMGGSLAALSKVTIDLVFTVLNNSQSSPVVNYAEIASSIPVGSSFSFDADSTPDEDQNNDAGGNPDTIDDNDIFGIEGEEEDDHDPISLSAKALDLGLIVTSEQKVIYEGDEVCFDVEITNQGFLPVGKVQVANFLPEEFVVMDPSRWMPDNGDAKVFEIEFENGLAPQASTTVTYCATVGNIDGKYSFVAVVEIAAIYSTCDDDISDKDIDSEADFIKGNDAGGIPETGTDNTIVLPRAIDEDDSDPVLFVSIESRISDPCVCLNNATLPDNGQFNAIVEINGPTGMTWYVDQVTNVYDVNSALPPATPTVLVTGPSSTPLPEVSPGTYLFTGLVLDGDAYELRFRSSNNDFQYISGGPCEYTKRTVTGAISLCDGGTATYSVNGNPLDTYMPTILGGTINATTNNGQTAEVTWTPGAPDKSIIFTNTTSNSLCEAPAVLDVVTGVSDIAMYCKGQVNISLGQSCEAEITPSLIIAGNPVPDAAYVVMLIDPNGNALTQPVINSSHVGKTMTAKLIEGCGGNSCWTNVFVEDKTAPIIRCEDVTVSCYKVDQYRGPNVSDNCGGVVTLNVVDSLFTPAFCQDYIGVYTKGYIAVDQYGNQSTKCNQRIEVVPVVLDSVKFPASTTMANALDCGGYAVDSKGHPHPSVAGAPVLEGLSLYPEFVELCGITATYSDEGPFEEGCLTKFIRTWLVMDNTCVSSTEMRTAEQIIIVSDKTAPTITCPADRTISASQVACEGQLLLPAATDLTDDCSSTLSVDVLYPGGSLIGQNGGATIYLAAADAPYSITYRVTDDCSRSNSCVMLVKVEDKTAPLAVCDKHTTISLLPTGITYMKAVSLDDGSYDACGLASMEARRMDLGAGCNIANVAFGPYVDFCCDDVDPVVPVIVELRVTDLAGNSNTCMVNVYVQDKTAPTISCPDGEVISCEIDYDLNDLSAYGTATYFDGCGADLSESAIDSIDVCREGYIIRTFTVDDGTTQVSCQQRISVVNFNDFDYSSVVWPEDFSSVDNACSTDDLHPDNLEEIYAYPTWEDGICDMVSANYKDKYFRLIDSDGTCFKIIRRWTVINYCDMKNDPDYEPLVYDQVLKVSNTEAPEIISDLSVDTFFLNENNCEVGFATLEAEADDMCTPDSELSYKYEIFLQGSTTSIDVPWRSGNTADASGNYPLGNHFILWSFEDMCGNIVTERQDFVILDDKKPTAGCLEAISIGLVPMDLDRDGIIDTEMACIWPDSLQRSSSHPCLPLDSLDFSFSSDGTLNELCFDCFSLGENIISLYVIDPYGNFDVCNVRVEVQDNNNVDFCPDLEDCITWPDDEEVTICNQGTSPVELDSEPFIDPTCMCSMFTTSFTDNTINPFPNATCTAIERTWTVSFTCGTNPITFSYLQKINVFNTIAPDILCPNDTTVIANEDCEAEVNLLDAIASNTNCSTGVTITNNSPFANANLANASGDYPQGTSVVVFTVSDACGNTNTCTTSIAVEDQTPPTLTCNSNTVTVNLSSAQNGSVSLQNIISQLATVDDNCANPTVLVTPATVTCNNIGNLSVTLTATAGGLTNTCMTNILVRDVTPPIAQCNNISVNLNSQGSVTLSQADINAIASGSIDNCSTNFVVTPSQFNCSQLGANSVVLRVTDNSGNSATCDAVVTVVDNIPPTINCGSLTVSLNASGSYSLTNADILALASGSDNCQIIISPSEVNFNCTNVGSNSILMTGNSNGQVVTCNATLIVQDTTSPTAVCNDITVTVGGMGSYMLTSDDIDDINDGTFDACGFTSTPSQLTFDCEDVANSPIIIEMTYEDPSGNTSTCEADVTVSIPPIGALQCNDISVFLNTAGTYTLTTADQNAMLASTFTGCDPQISFSQLTFDCADTVGVPVTVTVTNANGTTNTCVSNVSVSDTIAPVAQCRNITINVNASGVATVTQNNLNLLAAGSSDACGFTYSINQTSFDCNNVNQANQVILTVVDISGNVDTCHANVFVNDPIAPTAACQDITINLTGSGAGYTLSAADSTALVGTSSDNCGVFTASITPTTFNCADTLSPVTVSITLTDPSGNMTTCEASVTVVNMTTIMCITQDITVSLDPTGEVTITPQMIDNGSGAGCGGNVTLGISGVATFFCNSTVSPEIVTLTVTSSGGQSASCTAEVTIVDDIDPVVTCPPNASINCDLFTGNFNNFGTITVGEACSTIDTTITVNTGGLNQCGIGTASITYTVEDLSGNTGQCTQIITVTGPTDPFGLNNAQLPSALVIVDNCTDYDTSVTGSIIVDESMLSCTNLSISFSDDPEVPTGMCNDTITRTWTIVDTCQLDPSNTSAGIFTYVQNIVITDTIAPVITGPSVDTIFIPNPNMECEIFVDLSDSLSVEDCDTSLVVMNNSPFADDSLSIDPSGTYMPGTYNIQVTAVDVCGNADTSNFVIVITEPNYSLICNKLIANIDTITGMVCVAGDELATVTGICDPYQILLEDVESGVLDDTLKFDCDDLGDNGVIVYLYVNGMLFDSCAIRVEEAFGGSTIVTILDPTMFCDTMGTRISGLVKTYSNEEVSNVHVVLENTGMGEAMTDHTGKYQFPEMASGGSYMVKPFKREGLLEGVTTLDLIMIQRHLLGIAPLQSTYDVVAADINNDNRITASDLIALRKAILGVSTSFPNNDSWKLIDAEYKFPVYMNPFVEQYPMYKELEYVAGNRHADFIGVKIGDVNQSYVGLRAGEVSENRNVAYLAYENQQLVAYNQSDVLMQIENLNQEVLGVQLVFEVAGIVSDVRWNNHDVTLEYNQVGNTLYVNAYDIQAFDIANTELTISLAPAENGLVSDIISLKKELLQSEIYTANLAVSQIELKPRFSTSTVDDIVMAASKPNPWTEKTHIDFELPQDGKVICTVNDVSGKVIYRVEMDGKLGSNTLVIRDKDIKMVAGVLIVNLTYGSTTVQQKMIRIN